VIRRRELWACKRSAIPAERFIFLDETWAKTNMTRLYGRCPVGERLHAFVPHGHWQTTTLLTAIRHDGPIRQASLVYDGPMNGAVFGAYTREMLAPSLRPGEIVVMDNLGSHKAAGVREAVEAAGAELWYLPPYSPDLNPIEKLWSKVKAWLRRLAARTFETLVDAIAQALCAVSLDECAAYFRSCGYAT
jgi:transposase